MTERDVEWSDDLESACNAFKRDLRDWAESCVAEEDLEHVGDSHDQATYTTSWGPLLHGGGDPGILQFLRDFRDAARRHFQQSGAWRHGYWRRQEAHHGTEHFGLFLTFLYRLAPDDDETVRQFLDAAEHIGNWVPGVPAWFDWDTGLFRSMYLGTEAVSHRLEHRLNVADHLRLPSLCLTAFEASGKEQYMELATRHGGKWADAIVAGAGLPAGLAPESPLYALAQDGDYAYHGFAGMAGNLDLEVDRAENLFASGAVETMLELWDRTREDRFRLAAERLLDTMSTQLAEPDAGCTAASFRRYHRLTDDGRYRKALADACADLYPRSISKLGMEPHKRSGPRLPGFGQRNDKPLWFENGRPRRHNPLTLALQAEWTGDDALAACAVDLARTGFRLARDVLTGNRHHGCAANTVSAIARGHGRENNAGMVTAVLMPFMHRS